MRNKLQKSNEWQQREIQYYNFRTNTRSRCENANPAAVAE